MTSYDGRVNPIEDRSYALEELEALSGIPERTIRSYIARRMLPPPSGRGRAATYGEEHLTRLRFLQAVRAASPYDLPLELLARLLRELPPEQIERVARGEERVHAEVLPGVDTSLLRRKRGEDEFASLRPEFEAPYPVERSMQLFSMSAPRADPPEPVSDEIWSTIEVTRDLRLSMRGPAGATRDDLRRLARRLRAWLSEDSPG